MGSSTGRRKAEYVRFRERLQIERPPCCLQSGPWCTGVGLTVEHDPPLATAPTPEQWRGVLRGACKPCQDRQGPQVRNRHQNPTWTF